MNGKNVLLDAILMHGIHWYADLWMFLNVLEKHIIVAPEYRLLAKYLPGH